MSATTTALDDAQPSDGEKGTATPTFMRKTRHLGFLPIPRRLQYDPARPFEYSTLLVCIFGFASTMTVSNLYYAQPLLIQLAKSFEVSNTQVANVPTLTQAGYATGILLISPLGDLVPRRPLLLLLIVASSLLSLGLARAPSLPAFTALSFLVGVSTVTPQVLIPLAADLAPPPRRATAVGIVFSGLLLGLMVARVLAGIVAQFTGDPAKGDGWRNVYWMAFGVQVFTGILLYFSLPDWPAKNKNTGLTYWGVLYSMGKLMVTEPLLIQCSLIGFLSSAVFASFWVTLTFLLGGAPYFYSTVKIGLFGLVGILGVLSAPLVGRFVDRLASPWYATLTAILVLLVFLGIMLGAGTLSVGAVVVAVWGLDLGFQMQQLSNATRIYTISADARSRLNAIFIIWGFVGMVMGTQAGTVIFESFGPRANGGLNMGWVGGMLLLLMVRGPWCGKGQWVGGGGEGGRRRGKEGGEWG
ncbi:MFS general substrate transporter [Exidia glandulosa HHB12029]|uniref:MFS general substrate transporter n=1 Tax=Exidia glandulosa HHB12029 TaxID=1314781 RepID=A0A165DS27_EXIGL|nr:MFS general substrate transporter [Exidia glandulosa HHB12029]